MLNNLVATASSALTDFPNSSEFVGFTDLLITIFSAFFGGLFAAYWSNRYESKRRIHSKRIDRYFEHRNTLVQLEQELIPLRVNISRNISTLSNATQNTNENNVRIPLRFYNLDLSTGLGLKLLNLHFVNKYAKLYSAIESLNSDVNYVSGITSMLIEDKKVGKIDNSVIDTYKIFLPLLAEECNNIEKESLELLGMTQYVINENDEKIKNKYVKYGKEIHYLFTKKSLNKKYAAIKKEEDRSPRKKEKRPLFISPFLDLRTAFITSKIE